LRVPARGLAIITSNSVLPWARAGAEYQVRFAAWGGVRPYNWAASGPLPPGLKLQRDGTLAGIPEEGGDFRITVLVRDLQATVSREFSLHVSAARVDRFGGAIAVHSSKGRTGNWRTEKIGRRWVLITPEGNAFWMMAVWLVTGDGHADERGGNYDARITAKYGREPTKWAQANRRLKSWGFNVIAPYSYRMVLPTDEEPEWGGTQPVKLPFLGMGPNPSITGRKEGIFKNLYAQLDPAVKALKGQNNANFPDVFDPAWVNNTLKLYLQDKDLIRNSSSPYFIGAFSDDTDFVSGFGSGTDFSTDPPGKFHVHLGYLALVTATAQRANPYSSPPGQLYADQKVYTKFALRDFLRAKYGTITALNAAWNSSYSTFDSDGGWPNGKGLLDENGRIEHTWLGTGNPHLPAEAHANANLVSDLNEFLYRMARQFLTAERASLKQAAPHALFFGPSSIGAWWSPARAPIYRAAAEALDVLSVSSDCNQEQLDFITRATGDFPMIYGVGTTMANPDSSRWRHPDGGEGASWAVKDQPTRSRRYRQNMESLFTQRSSSAGSNQTVGVLWWAWMDSLPERANWGLVSMMDNAYDGVEAGITAGIDAWGYPTGSEEKNYGDFLGPAREMNYSIIERLSHEQNAGPAGSAGRGN
jgi:hypothetical protein